MPKSMKALEIFRWAPLPGDCGAQLGWLYVRPLRLPRGLEFHLIPVFRQADGSGLTMGAPCGVEFDQPENARRFAERVIAELLAQHPELRGAGGRS